MPVRLSLLIILSFLVLAAEAEECASTYTALDKTARLQAVKSVIGMGSRVGMVNESEGSYVIFDAYSDEMTLTFFTSGLFDLYPIKREGPLVFCDTGTELVMKAIGRSEKIRISEGKIEVGGGGPKRVFSAGIMPEPLQRLHRFNVRELASPPSPAAP